MTSVQQKIPFRVCKSTQLKTKDVNSQHNNVTLSDSPSIGKSQPRYATRGIKTKNFVNDENKENDVGKSVSPRKKKKEKVKPAFKKIDQLTPPTTPDVKTPEKHDSSNDSITLKEVRVCLASCDGKTSVHKENESASTQSPRQTVYSTQTSAYSSHRRQLNFDQSDYTKAASVVFPSDVKSLQSPQKPTSCVNKPPLPKTPSKIKSLPSSPRKNMSPYKRPVISLRRPDAAAYQKAKQVLHTSLPDHLIGRDKETEHVQSFLTNHLKNNTSGSLYISGAPGTGKTAVVSHVIKHLQSQDSKSKMKIIFVNCMALKDSIAIYTKIVSELSGKVATCRSSKEALACLNKSFNSTGRPVLLVLDEIDQLDSVKQEVLYTMFEWPSLPNSKLLLIGIANSLDLTDRLLPRLQTRPKCRPELMNFTPYSKDEIIKVIQDRLQQISVTSDICVLEQSAIQFCARKVSAVSGDIRKALDVCRRAVEVVEKEVKSQSRLRSTGCPESPVKTNSAYSDTKTIGVKQISQVVSEVYSSNIIRGGDQPLPLQQKLVVCALLVLLNKSKTFDITVAKLYETYSRICKKRNMTAVDQSEFLSLCQLIETRGVLLLKKAKDIRSSKIKLKYDIKELEHALQDQLLISSILKENLS